MATTESELTVYRSTSTSDGAGDGTTIVDIGLTSEPDLDGNLVIITSGTYKGQARDISGTTIAGTITVGTAFGGKILSGTTYIIAGIRTGSGIKNTDAEMRDAVLNDATKFAGGNIDAAITTRSSHSATNVRQSVCVTGDPGNSIGKALYEIYVNRLTTARAGYLDEINAVALAQNAGSVASNAEVDSLVRAIADILRTGGTTPNAIIDAIEADNLDHLLKTNLPTNPATDIAANSALGHVMGTADMASFDRATDSLQSIRDSADTGYANVINIIGEGGHTYTAQAATAPGDNVAVMGGQRYIHGAIGTEYVNGNGVPEIDNIRAHLFKTGGMGGGVATKTLTFANDAAGTVALFTVTGDVIVKIIAGCSTLVASAAGANVEVGIPADTDGIIATTLATDIDADEIWHDASPDSQIEALSTMREYIILNGADIGILLSAQVDTGVITFHCIWTGLNGGTVVSV